MNNGISCEYSWAECTVNSFSPMIFNLFFDARIIHFSRGAGVAAPLNTRGNEPGWLAHGRNRQRRLQRLVRIHGSRSRHCTYLYRNGLHGPFRVRCHFPFTRDGHAGKPFSMHKPLAGRNSSLRPALAPSQFPASGHSITHGEPSINRGGRSVSTLTPSTRSFTTRRLLKTPRLPGAARTFPALAAIRVPPRPRDSQS
jgi:hypothetical protein